MLMYHTNWPWYVDHVKMIFGMRFQAYLSFSLAKATNETAYGTFVWLIVDLWISSSLPSSQTASFKSAATMLINTYWLVL